MATRKPSGKSSKNKVKAVPRADGVTWLTAAEYGRRVGVGKSRMSDYIRQGMPYADGKDAEGRRDCKLVNVHEADAWRLANVETRVGADGSFRGLSLAGGGEPLAQASEACDEDLVEEGVGAQVTPPAAARLPAPPPTPIVTRSAPQKPPPAAPVPPTPSTSVTASAAARIAEAKALSEEMATEGRAINLAKAKGQVVDRSSALELVEAFGMGVRATIERKPVERAARVAALLGSTPHAAMLALREVFDELQLELAELAGEFEADLEGLGD